MSIESLTLGAVVTAVYQHDSPAVQQEALQAALADPGGALTCYTAMADERGLTLTDNDDRRTCRDCASLALSGVCSVATPALAGWYRHKRVTPGAMFLEYPHRCEAFNARGANYGS